jgi:hypothetical protein
LNLGTCIVILEPNASVKTAIKISLKSRLSSGKLIIEPIKENNPIAITTIKYVFVFVNLLIRKAVLGL